MTEATDPRQEWATPAEFIAAIDVEFDIGMDVAASDVNAVADTYYTREEDGLTRPWFLRGSMSPTIWCNPGFKDMASWVDKAIHEVSLGPERTALLMGLAAVSTQWWARACQAGAEVRLLSPRVQFVAPAGIEQSSNARENALLIFRTPPSSGQRPPHIWRWQWKEGA